VARKVHGGFVFGVNNKEEIIAVIRSKQLGLFPAFLHENVTKNRKGKKTTDLTGAATFFIHCWRKEK
jgi:hypothetical protein